MHFNLCNCDHLHNLLLAKYQMPIAKCQVPIAKCCSSGC